MIKPRFSRDPGIIASVLEILEKHDHVSDGLDHGNVVCVFCEMVVIWAQNHLRKNTTNAKIKTSLNQVSIPSRHSCC